MAVDNILVIGAGGQIGSALIPYLSSIFGEDHVVASDLRESASFSTKYIQLDATNGSAIAAAVQQYKITQIYHLAAILSARGEADPLATWDINMKTCLNVLEVARTHNIRKVFFPSSIAVFGDFVNRDFTHQESYLVPATTYGLTKAAGENWSNYYFQRYGLDVRSIRYPGIISHESMPGGGTTDYAVDIFHKVVQGQKFTCFLKEDTALPMIYMEDALRATLELMEAPAANISIRTSYNLQGVSFTPSEIAAEIAKTYPAMQIEYVPDFRQQIADSWPKVLDDSAARADWGWKPTFDLPKLCTEMISNLELKYGLVPTLV